MQRFCEEARKAKPRSKDVEEEVNRRQDAIMQMEKGKKRTPGSHGKNTEEVDHRSSQGRWSGALSGKIICDLFTVGEVVFWSFWSLWVLSRSRRLSLPCVFCRDPGDCLSLVPVWFGRIGFQKGFLVSDGK